MPKPLSEEQLEALRRVPLLDMPNKVQLALTFTQAQQKDIVVESGLTTDVVHRIVTGKKQAVSVDEAGKLAAFFGCAIEDLFPAREAVA
jgi:DNA-binding Xre family transcriptional regulator